MAFIKSGGFQWSHDLILWGSRGRGLKSQLLGYYPKKDGQGAPSADEIRNWTVDLWDVFAVYSLFHGETLLYVGEGKLGDCLKRHHSQDEFSNKWDAFSWVSPFDIGLDDGKAKLKAWNDQEQIKIPGKELVETLELVVVRLSEPFGNRQNPTLSEKVKWLTQVRPKNFLTLEEKIDELLTRLPITKNKKGKQK